MCGRRHRPLYGRGRRPRSGVAVGRGSVGVLGVPRPLPWWRRGRAAGRHRSEGRGLGGRRSCRGGRRGGVRGRCPRAVRRRLPRATGHLAERHGRRLRARTAGPVSRGPGDVRCRGVRGRGVRCRAVRGPCQLGGLLGRFGRNRTLGRAGYAVLRRAAARLRRTHEPVLRRLRPGRAGRIGPCLLHRTGPGGGLRTRGASRAAPPLQLRPGGLTVVHALPRIRPRSCAGHHHLAAYARSGVRRPEGFNQFRAGPRRGRSALGGG